MRRPSSGGWLWWSKSSCSLCPPAKRFASPNPQSRRATNHTNPSRPTQWSKRSLSARKVIRKQLGVVTIQPCTGHSRFFVFFLFLGSHVAGGHDNFCLHLSTHWPGRSLVCTTARTTLRPPSHHHHTPIHEILNNIQGMMHPLLVSLLWMRLCLVESIFVILIVHSSWSACCRSACDGLSAIQPHHCCRPLFLCQSMHWYHPLDPVLLVERKRGRIFHLCLPTISLSRTCCRHGLCCQTRHSTGDEESLRKRMPHDTMFRWQNFLRAGCGCS